MWYSFYKTQSTDTGNFHYMIFQWGKTWKKYGCRYVGTTFSLGNARDRSVILIDTVPSTLFWDPWEGAAGLLGNRIRSDRWPDPVCRAAEHSRPPAADRGSPTHRAAGARLTRGCAANSGPLYSENRDIQDWLHSSYAGRKGFNFCSKIFLNIFLTKKDYLVVKFWPS